MTGLSVASESSVAGCSAGAGSAGIVTTRRRSLPLQKGGRIDTAEPDLEENHAVDQVAASAGLGSTASPKRRDLQPRTSVEGSAHRALVIELPRLISRLARALWHRTELGEKARVETALALRLVRAAGSNRWQRGYGQRWAKHVPAGDGFGDASGHATGSGSSARRAPTRSAASRIITAVIITTSRQAERERGGRREQRARKPGRSCFRSQQSSEIEARQPARCTRYFESPVRSRREPRWHGLLQVRLPE
jgi:hypothetical protein